MQYKPSSYQQEIFDFVKYGYGNAVINAKAGSGKCLGFNTEVLMYDCTIKKVQDIKTGDLLMGDDSTPRTVLNTNIGYGSLRRITPKKGLSWICNDVHILSVQKYHNPSLNKSGYYYKEDISIDIIEEESESGAKLHPDGFLRPYKLYRTALEFTPRKVSIDPWLYGIWLGDGTTKYSAITNPDNEIIEEIYKKVPEGNFADVKIYKDKNGKDKCEKICINACDIKISPFRRFIKSSLLNDEKIIKKEYLYNSREIRLALLAGLIDSDGYVSKNSCEIAVKYDNLAKDILFLCRSLGFAAYDNYREKICYNNGTVNKYHIISISGDLSIIPNILMRKKATKRTINKDVLRVGFKIERIEDGDYYGFTLDGNGRFLLGDLTVTHNTSTAVQAIDFIKPDKKILFLAFNNSIVDELTKKIIREKTDIKTLHSLGFSTLLYNYKNLNLTVDELKYQKKLRSVLEDNPVEITPKKQKRYKSNILKLTDLGRFYLAKNENQLETVAVKHNIIIIENEIEIAFELISWGKVSLEETKTVDFSDMIYLPNVLPIRTFKYDFIFIDEAQDLSIAQFNLFLKYLKQGGRFVAIGDNSQCINGFVGSSQDSFDKLKALPSTIELPLSICYRCPKKVIELAKKIVPGIEAREDAPDGYIKYNATVNDVKDGDMIICRNTLPLIKLYLELITNGTKAYVKGKDIGINLINLVENVDQEYLNVDLSGEGIFSELYNSLLNYIEQTKNTLDILEEDVFETQEFNNLIDSIQCLEIVSNGLETKNELLDKLNLIFSDESTDGICLSTIHKSKGLEADNVFILNKNLLPSKFVKQDWEKEQERNLEYVAITRAKKMLGFIYDKENMRTSENRNISMEIDLIKTKINNL